MKRITEKKSGKKSIFTVENIIADEVIDTKEINVQVDTVEVKGKNYHLIYDSQYNLISDAYDFLNHNQKKLSNNSMKASIYALRYLYVFSEIIGKSIENFDRNDFLRLNHFLSGVSADGTEYEYNLLTKRGSASINSFFSVYRELYRYLGYENSPVLRERSFSKYIPSRDKSKHLHTAEVPKYISTEDFAAIVKYIRENIKDKERRLRDECMVRIMYEGGCRLGEVLGSTLEDYVVQEVNGDDICFVYIRNRLSDKEHQNAKTCMNVQSKRNYSSDTYKTNGVGYQLTFLNMDTYDLICDYIDLAHDKAYKKYRANYDAHKADAVGDYKAKNEDNYYLFLNNRGEPLSDEGWNKELRMIFNAVGIQLDSGSKKDNLSHRFRHGFIMHLIYDLKIPREQVMVRSRHRNYASLDAYYNPTTEQIIKMKTEIEDNILDLVERYHESNCKDKSILVDVNRAIKSNPELYSKKELIDLFVKLTNVDKNTRNHWKDFVEEQKRIELEAMIRAYNLNRTETAKFIDAALQSGELKLSGEGINRLLPRVSRFSKTNNTDYSETKKIVCQKLKDFFDKYYDVI